MSLKSKSFESMTSKVATSMQKKYVFQPRKLQGNVSANLGTPNKSTYQVPSRKTPIVIDSIQETNNDKNENLQIQCKMLATMHRKKMDDMRSAYC